MTEGIIFTGKSLSIGKQWMNLDEAQQLVCRLEPEGLSTVLQMLTSLSETVHLSEQAYHQEQVVLAQQYLEDALLQTLITMGRLGISGEQALFRAIRRLETGVGKRYFVIYPEHVDIWVQGQSRGGWPLYSQEDYETTLQVARELRCDVVYADSQQLDLFISRSGISLENQCS